MIISPYYDYQIKSTIKIFTVSEKWNKNNNYSKYYHPNKKNNNNE